MRTVILFLDVALKEDTFVWLLMERVKLLEQIYLYINLPKNKTVFTKQIIRLSSMLCQLKPSDPELFENPFFV